MCFESRLLRLVSHRASMMAVIRQDDRLGQECMNSCAYEFLKIAEESQLQLKRLLH